MFTGKRAAEGAGVGQKTEGLGDGTNQEHISATFRLDLNFLGKLFRKNISSIRFFFLFF